MGIKQAVVGLVVVGSAICLTWTAAGVAGAEEGEPPAAETSSARQATIKGHAGEQQRSAASYCSSNEQGRYCADGLRGDPNEIPADQLRAVRNERLQIAFATSSRPTKVTLQWGRESNGHDIPAANPTQTTATGSSNTTLTVGTTWDNGDTAAFVFDLDVSYECDEPSGHQPRTGGNVSSGDSDGDGMCDVWTSSTWIERAPEPDVDVAAAVTPIKTVPVAHSAPTTTPVASTTKVLGASVEATVQPTTSTSAPILDGAPDFTGEPAATGGGRARPGVALPLAGLGVAISLLVWAGRRLVALLSAR